MSPHLFQNANRRHLVLATANRQLASDHQRSLQEIGWEARLASSGYAARRLAQEGHPELVIVEERLPEESGWLTCAKLSFVEPRPEVLLLCDHITAQTRKRALFVGVRVESVREDLVALLSNWPQRIACAS
ncbi:MAG: response regulator [Gemmataceae bacterium]